MPKVAKVLSVVLFTVFIYSAPNTVFAACFADTSGSLDTMYLECTGTPDTITVLLKFKSDNPAADGLAGFGWPVLVTVTNNALINLDTTVATTFGGTACASWPLPVTGTGSGGADPAVSPVHFIIGNVQFGGGITGDLHIANIKIILTGDTTTIAIDTLAEPPTFNNVVTVTTCEYTPYWMPDTCIISSVKNIHGPESSRLPTNYDLGQNFPNPFNATTQIQFALPKSGHVKLEIFNVLGQKVKTLVDEELTAGYKQVLWDGTDQRGDQVSSGIYFYRVRMGSQFTEMKKMVMIK